MFKWQGVAAGIKISHTMNDQELRTLISNGVDAAKRGEAVNVYNTVMPYYQAGRVAQSSHYALGWIIYYALHQAAKSDIEGRKRMLGQYLKLSTPRPHKLHSMILTEAIRLYNDAGYVVFRSRSSNGQQPVGFSIIRFLKLWDPENLREGDWRRKRVEDKDMSSTVEKLITICVDELKGERSALNGSQVIPIIDRACEMFPESVNLLAQRATLHRLTGEKEKSAALVRRALLLAPGKGYLWADLAASMDLRDNPRLHVAFLAKALWGPGPEYMKGRIRLALAEVWCRYESYARALWELTTVKDVYEPLGWHLPSEYAQLIRKIPQDLDVSDPTAAYLRLMPLAEEELYSHLPEIVVRKTFHKVPTREDVKRLKSYIKPCIAWRLNDESGNAYWIQPHRFGLDPEMPIGSVFTIRVHKGRCVKLRPGADSAAATADTSSCADPNVATLDASPCSDPNVATPGTSSCADAIKPSVSGNPTPLSEEGHNEDYSE